MTQGKGDSRRPMTIDARQLDFNWTQTFNERDENKDQDQEYQSEGQGPNPRFGLTEARFDPQRCGYNRRYNR